MKRYILNAQIDSGPTLTGRANIAMGQRNNPGDRSMPTRNSINNIPVAGSSLSTLRISIADMISLNVRSRGTRYALLPETLYQSMPARAMSLMATLPHGPFAVSIPGESRLIPGYPIGRELPPFTDGYTIIYSRKPNGRYEADAVKHQNRECQIEKFIGVAGQWVEQLFGNLKSIPGRYAYAVPSRDEWGVILRDSGFTAWDPLRMSSEGLAGLRAKRQAQQSSAVSIRIPLYSGEKPSTDEGLPVFAPVEVALDPDPGTQSAWISFAEYQLRRELRACLPESVRADFHEWLKLLTEESGFKYWIFNRGMLFGDCIEWWGDCSRRRTAHEGIDFAKGFQPGSGISCIPEGLAVRSIADGEVTAMLDDFLGKTVVVRHPSITSPNGDVFHTLLSHIQPLITKMGPMAKGQVIGKVGSLKNGRVPIHLHLTGAWFPGSLSPNEITIDHIHPAFDPVALVNFNDLLLGNPLCRRNPPESA
jgi:murein DD-endopeptidase MepM/ murein hydrolase activator NlpD